MVYPTAQGHFLPEYERTHHVYPAATKRCRRVGGLVEKPAEVGTVGHPPYGPNTDSEFLKQEHTMWNVLALIAVEYAVTAVVSEVWDAVVDD